MKHVVTRRTFLKSAAAAGVVTAFSARSWSQVVGANGDVRVAVVGLNGRGLAHLKSLKACRGARVVALCDVDTAVLAKAKQQLGGEVKTYGDVRELLAARDIDAATIATPNHWHALGAIWACQAGKDVYVEKPVSHNVWEGRQLVLAAKKFNRVVQAGTQIRSGEGLQEAVAWIRAGNLGKITVARGFCYKRRDSIGRVATPPAPPATVDLDLWCGPAPLERPHRAKFHYDWHWQWPTGNGDVGNQGIHQMDVARWFLGERGLPRRTLSIGGRLGYVDDGETPNTQVIWHDYATAPLVFEVRGLPAHVPASAAEKPLMDEFHGVSIGNIIECEGGLVVVPNYFTATAYDRDGKIVKAFKGVDRHMQNFIDAVQSRKTSDLYGPIDEGHVSSALCHLGNISHRLGNPRAAAEIAEDVRARPVFSDAYGRMREHLARNEIHLDRDSLVLGAPLEFDAARERFTGSFADRANPLLTRSYRAGYAVPSLS